jgi:hypothetical protein
VILEHALFAAVLLSGAGLMQAHGLGTTHARRLAL